LEALLLMSPGQIHTLADLRQFVHSELCRKENLLEDQFTLQESTLKSRGKACAVQFTLWGPRSIRLSAIWSCDSNVVYFYDTQGQRYDKLLLTEWIAVESGEPSVTSAA
jgi:hypothetical protein